MASMACLRGVRLTVGSLVTVGGVRTYVWWLFFGRHDAEPPRVWGGGLRESASE